MTKPPLSLEEAQERLLALAGALPIERTDIDGALGRYLVEPLRARRTQPARDLSAMDGYAIAAFGHVGPWKVTGESAAGHPHEGIVHPGQAVRIATGAIVPDGADAVILQEDVNRDGDTVTLQGTIPYWTSCVGTAESADLVEGVCAENGGAFLLEFAVP